MKLSNLAFGDFATTVCACVTILFLALPAYKRTKQVGFLFWCFSSLGSLWNVITLQTIGSDPHTNLRGFIFTQYSYRILFVVNYIVSIIGTILVIKGYLLLFESKHVDTNSSASGQEPT